MFFFNLLKNCLYVCSRSELVCDPIKRCSWQRSLVFKVGSVSTDAIHFTYYFVSFVDTKVRKLNRLPIRWPDCTISSLNSTPRKSVKLCICVSQNDKEPLNVVVFAWTTRLKSIRSSRRPTVELSALTRRSRKLCCEREWSISV